MCAANPTEIVGAAPPAPVQDQLEPFYCFPTTVYTIDKPEFLKPVKEVAIEALRKAKSERKLDEIYPVYMTESLIPDPRLDHFSTYVSATAWNILKSQGYAMDMFLPMFTELWCQEHHKHSSMEQHVHGFGAQMVGFYFLDCPENCSKVAFHDPKAGKVQSGLPEENMNMASPASNMVFFDPKPGMLMFANSWLAHSFTRNASDKPMRFIHFNLSVQLAPQQAIAPAEVI